MCRFVKKEEEQDAIVLGFREKIFKVEGGGAGAGLGVMEGSVKSEGGKMKVKSK